MLLTPLKYPPLIPEIRFYYHTDLSEITVTLDNGFKVYSNLIRAF